MAVHGSGEYLRGGSSQHGCLLVTLHPPGLLSFDPDDRHFPRIFFYHPTLRLPSIFSSFFYSMSFLFLVYSLALVKKHAVVSSKWMRCKFWSPGVSQSIFILFSCLVNCLAEFRGLLKTWLHCFLFFGHLASSIAAEKSKAIWFLFFFSSVLFVCDLIFPLQSMQNLLFVPRAHFPRKCPHACFCFVDVRHFKNCVVTLSLWKCVAGRKPIQTPC